MPVLRPADAVRHEAHGAAFHALVAPSRGSAELCAWRLEVPAGQVGAPHRPSREEVLLVLDGDLHVTLDGVATPVVAGDVVLVPTGAELRVDGGGAPASVWVTTSPGLEAELADGSRLVPPWAR
ncbi:cupin domain-containing protein [Actinomycetospora straminea]|uniref:Cupin domain-containing protein n=1 Tax=Actinomycetospora straminea TaxID=663607 RepID=A0ABP9E0A1_9PSEU|nr:cupin domain-containing protein [Actinomycetospora straminea]MDD7931206.1 cupin domain-containing protein [Actinomycetospora straminea]